MNRPATMLDKIWASHQVVEPTDATPPVLYADLHLIHEVTSPQAFAALRARGLPVRRPDRTLATLDHSTPTRRSPGGLLPILDPDAARQIDLLRLNCRDFAIRLADLDSPDRGIVHVMGPELGATHPGMTIVCGDSHTSTHGAFGALAFGIGTSEVAMVLAAQCLPQVKPRSLAVEVSGALPPAVSAKDLILEIIRTLGVAGGAGSVIEYRGPAIAALPMEARMTVCNMSIEAGARAGMIAPDQTTFDDLRGRPLAPKHDAWDQALDRWRSLPSDPGARFDRTVHLDARRLAPMITWGTTPAMCVPISGAVPNDDNPAHHRARRYMGLEPGQPLRGLPVDVVFIGSCTNSRLSDLRAAASILRRRKVAPRVRALVVPGSHAVKRRAEAEGLHRVFLDAGAEWRDPGCSMCIAMNGDRVEPGRYALSTSNRNFEGRQGAGARTLLASPLSAAAAAVAGAVEDPRAFDLPGEPA